MTVDEPPMSEEEKLSRYEEVRRDMPIFNTNFISGGLFRGGINLKQYKIVAVGSEYLLVFRNEEEHEWMNLGRSDSKRLLERWANTLRRYLQELNRLCEAVYIVEKSLFTPCEPFTVAAVFTGWTARTQSPRSGRFRRSSPVEIAPTNKIFAFSKKQQVINRKKISAFSFDLF